MNDISSAHSLFLNQYSGCAKSILKSHLPPRSERAYWQQCCLVPSQWQKMNEDSGSLYNCVVENIWQVSVMDSLQEKDSLTQINAQP